MVDLMSSENSEAPMAATIEASNLSVSTKELTMKSLAKSTVNCTNSIIISDIKIHMDSEGRYSLNDLHKAAGKERRHEPANWINLEQTTELVNEILNTGIPVFKNHDVLNAEIPVFKPMVSKKGRYGGTYVCKELVYSYAMWIRAAFALKVIRAYDALVTGNANEAVRIAKTTVSERTPLRDAVNMLVGKKGLRYDDAYNMVHQRFGIDSIDELSLDQIPQAVEYIHRVVLEGEYLGKQEELPAPKLDINFPISWFEDNAPYAVTSHPDCHKVHLDYYSLREMVSPSYLVMKELTKQGYDVSAAMAEMKAMRHVMIEQAWALKEISKYTGIREKAAVRIEL